MIKIKNSNMVFKRKLIKKPSKSELDRIEKGIVMIMAVRFLENIDEERSSLNNINMLHSALHFTLKSWANKYKKEMAEADGMEMLLIRALNSRIPYTLGTEIIVDSPTTACYMLLDNEKVAKEIGKANRAIAEGILEDTLKVDYVTKKSIQSSSWLALECRSDIQRYLFHRKQNGDMVVIGSINTDSRIKAKEK